MSDLVRKTLCAVTEKEFTVKPEFQQPAKLSYQELSDALHDLGWELDIDDPKDEPTIAGIDEPLQRWWYRHPDADVDVRIAITRTVPSPSATDWNVVRVQVFDWGGPGEEPSVVSLVLDLVDITMTAGKLAEGAGLTSDEVADELEKLGWVNDPDDPADYPGGDTKKVRRWYMNYAIEENNSGILDQLRIAVTYVAKTGKVTRVEAWKGHPGYPSSQKADVPVLMKAIRANALAWNDKYAPKKQAAAEFPEEPEFYGGDVGGHHGFKPPYTVEVGSSSYSTEIEEKFDDLSDATATGYNWKHEMVAMDDDPEQAEEEYYFIVSDADGNEAASG